MAGGDCTEFRAGAWRDRIPAHSRRWDLHRGECGQPMLAAQKPVGGELYVPRIRQCQPDAGRRVRLYACASRHRRIRCGLAIVNISVLNNATDQHDDVGLSRRRRNHHATSAAGRVRRHRERWRQLQIHRLSRWRDNYRPEPQPHVRVVRVWQHGILHIAGTTPISGSLSATAPVGGSVDVTSEAGAPQITFAAVGDSPPLKNFDSFTHTAGPTAGVTLRVMSNATGGVAEWFLFGRGS
jgi:hypothetical protein